MTAKSKSSYVDNKGFAHLILIILVAVISIGTVGYLAYKNGQSNKLISIETTVTPHITGSAPNELNNWQTYINTKFNFSFLYPDTFAVFKTDLVGNQEDVQLADETDIDIYVNQNNSTEEKGNYFTFRWGSISSDETWNKTDVEINGESFEKFVKSDGKASYDIYKLRENPDNFSLFVSNDRTKSQVANQILSTFKFLTSGACKPIYEVHTGPELTAEENYSMECLGKTTEKECLTVDIYNSSQKDFSKPDGASDCKWISTPQCKPSEEIKQCKSGPCCCPVGAMCD